MAAQSVPSPLPEFKAGHPGNKGRFRRGMLRLWLVASVVWMSVVGYEMCVSWIPDLGWYNLQLVDAQERATKAEKYGWGETSREKYLAPAASEFLDLVKSGRIQETTSPPNIGWWVLSVKPRLKVMLVPPVFVLVVGVVFGWVLAGFRRDT
jgi:hypothetical protein